MSLSPQGFGDWEPVQSIQPAWLDGFLEATIPIPVSMREQESPAMRLKTHAGTSILQVWMNGTEAPDAMVAHDFALSWPADSDVDYKRITEIRSGARIVYFSFGLRVVDTFTAVAGSSYKIARPRAFGIVTGVDETSHPSEVLLAGVATPSAITWIDGQSFTANNSGRIDIHYTAAHPVWIESVDRNLVAKNLMRVSCVLSECLFGDFD